MAIMTHAKFHFNWLMLTLIFGIWASEPPGPGERLKRPGLIGLMHHLQHSSATQYTTFLLHFCGFGLCINEQFNLSILGTYTYKLGLFIIVF